VTSKTLVSPLDTLYLPIIKLMHFWSGEMVSSY